MNTSINTQVTRSGRVFTRNDRLQTEPCFPFLKLPAEVRLMIYRFLLHVDRVDVDTLYICGCDHYTYAFCDPNRNAALRSGTSLRSPWMSRPREYPTGEMTSYDEPELPVIDGHAKVNATWTLTLRPNPGLTKGNVMAVCRQIRIETVTIFFRENTFNFNYPAAVIPFMRDCTRYAVKNLQKVWLRLCFDRECQGRLSKRWKRTFQYMARHLYLQQLAVLVEIPRSWLYEDYELDIDSEYMDWLTAAVSIKGIKEIDCKVTIEAMIIDSEKAIAQVEALSEAIRTYTRSELLEVTMQ